MSRHTGPVIVDLQALQSPSFRARGIGRYAREWAFALEHLRPDLVGTFLLNPRLPPPGELDELLATGKVRYGDARDAISGTSRILHSLAPLDTSVAVAELWPHAVRRSEMALTATVYDCIPALEPLRHLEDVVERSRYLVRCELLRGARQLHVLSRSVGEDLQRILALPARRVVLAGAAPSARFAPPSSRAAAAARIRDMLPDLAGGYVLYPTGSHPRKNNEQLVRAWSLLSPDVRASRRLVLTGELAASTVHHLELLAEQAGVGGSVVATGLVTDETLLALYQGAELVCFPSLAEGFGLPVAEALACGTPVIASDRPPLDDLVAAPRRFDPEDPVAIASSIAAALDQGRGPTSDLVDGSSARSKDSTTRAARDRWTDVAARTACAFDELLRGARGAAPRAGRPQGRARRIAFVSPLPPAPTGIAAYSYRLLEALQRACAVEIDAFADGPTPDQHAPEGVELFRAHALGPVGAVRNGYDAIVYTLGNSHHHLGALAQLRVHRGLVVSHDVRLTNLYRHEHGDPGLLPGGLGRAIRAMYGDELPASLGHDGAVSAADVALYGLLMAREAVRASTRFLVTSHAAADLATLDAGAQAAGQIAVLPFAMAAATDDLAASFSMVSPPTEMPATMTTRWGAPPEDAHNGTVVAHFGIVDPAKRPDVLVEAFAIASQQVPGMMLAFVGPVSDDLARAIANQAETLGVGGGVVLTGPLATTHYRAWLARASVAVQLRRTSNGEASAAVGQCMASGIATVVSDVGWSRELPDRAVVKVPSSIGPRELATVLSSLAGDSALRATLGAAARAEAALRTFDATAAALLAFLGIEDRTPSGSRLTKT